MQFTWHLLVIIAFVLIGVCLFQKGEKTAKMSPSQLQEADMYRNYAYLLWGIAIAIAVYYFYAQRQKATMCGGGAKHYGTMCGKAHMYGKAGMRGKARMYGGGYEENESRR